MITEELTNKTVKPSDKQKVARIIADMLGVENSESLSPEVAINQGLRSLRKRKITKETLSVVSKMVALAQQVGIKIDSSLLPKGISEEKRESPIKFLDYMNDQEKEEQPEVKKNHHTKVGHTLDTDDHKRRRKVIYRTESLESSEDFLSEEELNDIVNLVSFEDIVDLYEEDDLVIIDEDTGDVLEEIEGLDESQLNEVLSRLERMKAKIRFARTAPRRERRLKIALNRRSDSKTINKRSRRLAIKMLKKRLMKKPPSDLTVAEKERVERMIKQRKSIVDRLAMKLSPKVRRLETDRLAHKKSEPIKAVV